jgi:hypothetical protein
MEEKRCLGGTGEGTYIARGCSSGGDMICVLPLTSSFLPACMFFTFARPCLWNKDRAEMCFSPLPGHVASHVGDLSGSLSQNQWSGSHGLS